MVALVFILPRNRGEGVPVACQLLACALSVCGEGVVRAWGVSGVACARDAVVLPLKIERGACCAAMFPSFLEAVLRRNSYS